MEKIPGTYLTKLRFVEMKKTSGGNKKAMYLFKCECGMYKVLCLADVKSKRTKSCGCWRKRNGQIQMAKINSKPSKTQFKPGNKVNLGNQYWKKRKKHVSGTKGKRRYKDKDGKYYFA